jgi:hypothetical protein
MATRGCMGRLASRPRIPNGVTENTRYECEHCLRSYGTMEKAGKCAERCEEIKNTDWRKKIILRKCDDVTGISIIRDKVSAKGEHRCITLTINKEVIVFDDNDALDLEDLYTEKYEELTTEEYMEHMENARAAMNACFERMIADTMNGNIFSPKWKMSEEE